MRGIVVGDQGPLAGLRVLDVTNDVGRFATKLLVEAGASVARVTLPCDAGPAMHDPATAARGGLLDWFYDGAKTVLRLRLDEAYDRDMYRRLAARADLVIDTLPPGKLSAVGLDHASLLDENPALVQVSLTPFGQTGPWAHWQTSDLVAAALGGVLSVSGSAEHAVNPFGRQSYHFGSYMAAICGLAGIHAARVTGAGQHVDLSLHETVVTSIEQIFFQYWFPDLLPLPAIAPRQGSLHWLGAYVVTKCRTGWCNVCPTPSHQPLFEWMMEEGMEGAGEIAAVPPGEILAYLPRVMAMIREFALTKDSGELFLEAQRRHVAFGEVQDVAQVARNPQHEFRSLFQDVEWDGPRVKRPRLPMTFHGTPAALLRAPSPAVPAEGVLDEWAARPAAAVNGANLAKPLEGLRVLDLTWVLAGPFCCRMLGDLGADIVKVQTAERATLVNDPGFPYYYCWNRSKRSVTVDMKQPGSLEIARKLIEASDVLIENYSAGVLSRLGLDYDTVRAWNPRIVYVTMSGCGHEGPWSRVITYAPTIHALCGITALSNPPGRGDIGAGFSLNDHAAGFTAAFAILAAIEARRATGVGQHVDIAQLEVGTNLVGAAVTDLLSNGRVADANGNVDPYAAFLVNEVFACADGELAVTVRDEADQSAVARVIGMLELATWCAGRTATEAMGALQAVGVPAGQVQNAADLMERDPQLSARALFTTLHSDVFGERPMDRFPARWSAMSLEPYRCAPNYLGEHNFEVLGGLLGMADDEIAVAIGDGILA